MAIDFPSSPTTGQVYTYAGVTYVYSAQGVWATAGASAVGIIGGSPQGRLTLSSTLPVMTSTLANQGIIYYLPYIGDRIPIYDGSNMVMTTIPAGLSAVTTDTTKSPAAIGVSKVNDWFVWNDAGTIRIGHGPDWTSDTARSAGTALVMASGIWLNNAAITNGPAASRGTYVGTTRSNASSQLDWIYGSSASGGGEAFFGVWNCYNRVPVGTMVIEATQNWTCAAATVRGFNNSLSNRVSAVFGLSEDAVSACANAMAYTPSQYGHVGIGYNSTSAFSGSRTGSWSQSAGGWFHISGKLSSISGLGFNFWQMLELGNSDTQIAGYFPGINCISGLEFNARM